MESADLEKELLCLCTHTHVSLEARRRIDLLSHESIDWDRLIRLGRAHRVTPLLYWNLKKAPSHLIPPPAIEELFCDFRANTGRSLFLIGELRTILNILQANDIMALPYKGPILAQEVYGDIALRTFSDIDILVNKTDFWRVRGPLAAEGYERLVQPNLVRDQLLLRSGEFGFVNSSRTCVVDVHWALGRDEFVAAPKFGDLVDNAPMSSILDTQTLCLSPEDLLLSMCVHGTKHAWHYLHDVCDVAEIICANTQLNWGRIAQKAEAMHAERMLFLGLLLANHLLEAPLPAYLVKTATADTSVRRMAVEIEAKMFKEPITSPNELNTQSGRLRLNKRLRDKIRALLMWFLLPTVAEYDALPLPEQLSQFYYILRPVRVLAYFILRPRLLARKGLLLIKSL
jgi:hypothetical protein